MKEGNKYRPLFDYLRFNEQDKVLITFEEIEAILGKALPNSAKTTHAWWSNRSKGGLQAESWMDAGYRVVDFDISGKYVVFQKSNLNYNVVRRADIILWNGTLIKALRQHMKLSQSQFAKELGVRQQTISEWEKNLYTPRRSMSKYLTIIAEQVNFQYIEDD